MDVWVLNSCVPGETEPTWPDVFATYEAGVAGFKKMMVEEWAINAPCDDDDKPLPMPDDPWAAVSMMAESNPGGWGKWELQRCRVEGIPETSNDYKSLLNQLTISAIGADDKVARLFCDAILALEDLQQRNERMLASILQARMAEAASPKQVWVLTANSNPGDAPEVTAYSSETDARLAFHAMMAEEWKKYPPDTFGDAPMPNDPEEAQRMFLADSGNNVGKLHLLHLEVKGEFRG